MSDEIYQKLASVLDTLPNGFPTTVSTLCDPASILDFCYQASPTQIGLTGVRSFMGGSSGTIFQDTTGAPIACPVPMGTATLE